MLGDAPGRLRAGMLKGDNLYNAQGELLGHVRDFLISLKTGQIDYVLVGMRGILGSKCFVVPWDAFRLDSEWQRLVLDVDKDELKKCPRFDKRVWSEAVDPKFAEAVDRHCQHAA